MGKSFSDILLDLEKVGKLNVEITQNLMELFSTEGFLKAMEIITLKLIQKLNFSPSGRILWLVGGKSKDYLIYPQKYCSCIDFYLHGIMKNRYYLCKHLIAQGIAENLKNSNDITQVIDAKDYNFRKIIKQTQIF